MTEWRMEGKVGKGRRDVRGRRVKPAMQSHGISNHDGKMKIHGGKGRENGVQNEDEGAAQSL